MWGHAVTGADITGSFSANEKLTCWKAFEKADESLTAALVNFGKDDMRFLAMKLGLASRGLSANCTYQRQPLQKLRN